jgi:dynein heavy chain 1
MVFAIVWGLGGSLKLADRITFVDFIQTLPEAKGLDGSALDYHVDVKTASWIPWQESVPSIEVPAKDIGTDVIVPTIDTVRHVDVLRTYNLCSSVLTFQVFGCRNISRSFFVALRDQERP